jgi:hypothetical protein
MGVTPAGVCPIWSGNDRSSASPAMAPLAATARRRFYVI